MGLILKRVCALFLCAVTLCSVCALPAAADNDGTYAIHGVTMETGADTAYVQVTAESASVLLVALYNADSGQLLGIGSLNITEPVVRREAPVTLSCARDENATLKAFLYDGVSAAPLCKSVSVAENAIQKYFGQFASDSRVEVANPDGTAQISLTAPNFTNAIYALFTQNPEREITEDALKLYIDSHPDDSVAYRFTADSQNPDDVKSAFLSEISRELIVNAIAQTEYSEEWAELSSGGNEGANMAFLSSEEDSHSAIGNNLMEYLRGTDAQYLLNKNNYGYTSSVEQFRTSLFFQNAVRWSDLLIKTGTEADLDTCMRILTNIIGLYDLDNAESLAAQKERDNLKSLRDYAMDFTGMAANAVSVHSGFLTLGDEASRAQEMLSKAIDGLDVFGNNVDGWIKTLSSIETITQDYAAERDFLALIEENADGNLKKAASILRGGLAKTFCAEMEMFASRSTKDINNLGKFIFDDFFIDILKTTRDYETDASTKMFVDFGEDFLTGVSILKNSWDLGKAIGKLVGNIVVGGEDLITRSHEMGVLYDISVILQNELADVTRQFNNAYAGNGDEEEAVRKYVSLSRYLVAVRIRGEYCLYSIVAHDAGLLAWCGKGSAQEAEMWYHSKSAALISIRDRLNKVLDITSSSLRGTITEEDTGAPVPGATVTVTDEDGAVQTAITDSNGDYVFYPISPGVYYVRVSENNHDALNSAEVRLERGSDETVNLLLRRKRYTFIFDANGGTPSMSIVTSPDIPPLPTPTRDGYAFAGWNTAADGSGVAFTANTAVTGDMTVYAQWTSVPVYTVTFNSNGGTVTTGSVTVSSGNALRSLPTASRAGYDFTGWNTAADGSGSAFTANTTVTRNITVYAQWANNRVPDGAVYYGGHAYLVYKDEKTWQNAKEYCEQMGGHLVTITSQAEQDFVAAYIRSLVSDTDLWIGIHSDWSQWITGERVSYTNWGTNEPDGLSGQNCGAICNGVRNGSSWHMERGQWDDLHDYARKYFICEWD